LAVVIVEATNLCHTGDFFESQLLHFFATKLKMNYTKKNWTKDKIIVQYSPPF
jgi:hypothetical protein